MFCQHSKAFLPKNSVAWLNCTLITQTYRLRGQLKIKRPMKSKQIRFLEFLIRGIFVVKLNLMISNDFKQFRCESKYHGTVGKFLLLQS